MPDRTIQVILALTLDDADDRSIRSVAAEGFGVEGAADMTLPDVVAAVIRNTVEAQFHGFGVPVTVVDSKADVTDG